MFGVISVHSFFEWRVLASAGDTVSVLWTTPTNLRTVFYFVSIKKRKENHMIYTHTHIYIYIYIYIYISTVFFFLFFFFLEVQPKFNCLSLVNGKEQAKYKKKKWIKCFHFAYKGKKFLKKIFSVFFLSRILNIPTYTFCYLWTSISVFKCLTTSWAKKLKVFSQHLYDEQHTTKSQCINIYIHIYIYIYIHWNIPHEQDVTQVELNTFHSRIFLLLNWLPYKVKKKPTTTF